jgi:HTH-type transcriptional regulator/antitoxin HigA
MSDNTPEKLFDDSAVPPGQYIRDLLNSRGWTQDDLASVMGRPRQAVNEIILGKRGITADTAILLEAALGKSAQFWMSLSAAQQIAQAKDDTSSVKYRARIYDIAPIKDMQRRGWITPSKSITEIESELRRFFGVESLESVPEFPVSARKTASLADLTPTQQAWCFRARQLAEAIQTKKFDPKKLGEVKKNLRVLAKFPKNAIHVPELLGDYGIRFVVIEPLPGAKIDGAAFWLDRSRPVIAVSARYDRIDAFWHTLMHEFAHIEHEDDLSVDDSMVGDDAIMLVRDEKERRADTAASAALVDPKQLDSFIRRVGPLYSKTKIIQFAHRINMHPGVIVGQLQHLGEVGYAAHREMLVKIRSIITKTALTDGWGRTISPDHI